MSTGWYFWNTECQQKWKEGMIYKQQLEKSPEKSNSAILKADKTENEQAMVSGTL